MGTCNSCGVAVVNISCGSWWGKRPVAVCSGKYKRAMVTMASVPGDAQADVSMATTTPTTPSKAESSGGGACGSPNDDDDDCDCSSVRSDCRLASHRQLATCRSGPSWPSPTCRTTATTTDDAVPLRDCRLRAGATTAVGFRVALLLWCESRVWSLLPAPVVVVSPLSRLPVSPLPRFFPLRAVSL
jgi:hypothetical protein